ncbi:flagellar MS-ring protein [Mesobacillus campisalis]|uniref:Flagellar M-ring protein n=1 Tax=Mesobacillus campisalis TaxID=1408103 RepID=A0A0M2T2E9_9BACI|nr:flagellar basal-body MS-ring/collar protein FliF [Mesobacillus campisalis]KKK38995.1 flagellar MS-ring protein [Mesobacillus campisalis]
MNERITRYKNKTLETWGSFPGKTRWLVAGTFVLTLGLLIVMVYMSSKPNLSPLYSGLSPSEAGEIKSAIEERGIVAEVSADGTAISVPKEEVANLKVALAAEGIPKSGNVNYSIFSENMGMGMTDRQFDVVERDAMQNELAFLVKQIAGVNDANVMITLPKENIWITDEEQAATASVVIKGDPAFQLDQKQVNGLYHLISKSVPNLPTDQIVIMDQSGRTYDLQEGNPIDTALGVYQQQREIRKDIEEDIQRELQQMLGLILGRDKVVVSVMASVDFTKEKREEQLVEPVTDDNQGIEISVERIRESYSSEGGANGATGTGTNPDIPNYEGVDGAGNSESERTEDRINREVNRINRQIELSPYVIDDLTVNVGVEPPEPGNPVSLTQQTVGDIRNLLTNVVSNSLSMNGALLSEEELDSRISVFATEFQGKAIAAEQEADTGLLNEVSSNVLLVAGVVLAAILLIVVIAILVRRRKRKQEEEFFFDLLEEPVAQAAQAEKEEIDLSEFTSRANPKRKTIEKLAKERPEDFAKLLRSWMSQD